jgi:hypothetical protein
MNTYYDSETDWTMLESYCCKCRYILLQYPDISKNRNNRSKNKSDNKVIPKLYDRICVVA